MDRAAQLVGQRGIDTALAFDAGDAIKSGRHDPDMEMGLALAAIAARGAGMAGMAVAFVHHIQRRRRESGGQFLPNCVRDRHL